MTTKWTKGPWKAQLTEGWGWVVLAGKTFIAFKLRSKADARLIASAPQLYEALESLLECGRKDLSNPKYDGYFETAKAALRQARGEDK